MNRDQTLMEMRELHLEGMYEAYENIMALPVNKQPEAHSMVTLLIGREKYYRRNKKKDMYLKLSKMRYKPQLEEVLCSKERNISKEQIARLSDCNFIKEGKNILISGSTGCGKSYLGCAIAYEACCKGHKTLYFNMNRFIDEIGLSKLNGSYIKLLNKIEKHSLIILDDFGIQPMTHEVKIALLQILEDRYNRKSTIMISQLPINKWGEYINEPTIADAIIDRVLYNSEKLELKGKSMRDHSAEGRAAG